MNMLISAKASQTMSSREIAELTGKEHRNVMRDIRTMLVELHGEGGVLSFEQTYTNPQNNQSYPCYALPKRQTLILISGYSISMRAKIIDRWQELEAQAPVTFDITNPVHLLQAIEVQARLNIQLAAERDQAIATKSQISDKKVATAMATASHAKRKVNTLEAELGRCKDHATIVAVQNVTRHEHDWWPLKKWCKERGIKPIEVVDPRWGKVKSWPTQAWLDVYGVDIGALFGGKTS